MPTLLKGPIALHSVRMGEVQRNAGADQINAA